MKHDFRVYFTKLSDLLAGEFILKIFKANGGDVVLLRTLWTTLIFTVISIAVVSFFDPYRVGPISLSGTIDVFWSIANHISIFIGASYLALYARFVSQWSYLANLYNLIKQAEAVADAKSDVIAEWKAGYLEDAENLHLAAKNNLAPILNFWTQDQEVINAYIKNTPGGEKRLQKLQYLASNAFNKEALKWK